MRNGEGEQKRPIRSQLVNVLAKRVAILAAEATAGAIVTNSIEGAVGAIVAGHVAEGAIRGWLSTHPKGTNTFNRGTGSIFRDGE